MLSTPPAFNLSQNQTLQFKSVQDSCFRRNRNLKDFLPTRYSLVNEPPGLFGPPTRLVAAWREERLCPLSFPESTTFFTFRESFSRRPSVVFPRREERLCSPLLSKSTTFFRLAKLFVPPREPSRFPQSREAVMLPYAPTVNCFFCIPANFAVSQCVDPVTREMQCKQTPFPCQHKNHFCTDIRANAQPGPNSRYPYIQPHTPVSPGATAPPASNRSSYWVACLPGSSAASSPSANTPKPRPPYSSFYRCIPQSFRYLAKYA